MDNILKLAQDGYCDLISKVNVIEKVRNTMSYSAIYLVLINLETYNYAHNVEWMIAHAMGHKLCRMYGIFRYKR